MANKQLPADLETFVSNEVATLCDADPVVLAQYIVALIGTGECNDALKTNLESKLNEFFDEQTIPFIDRLFTKIKESSVTENSQAAATAAAVDPPASSTSNTNKERFTDFSDDEDDGDRNFKHRRQRSHSPEEQSRSHNKRRFEDDHGSSSANSKYQRYDDRRSNNASGGYNNNNSMYDQRGSSRGGRGGMRGRGGSSMGRGPNKGQCRDYNEKGFCMRGDMCPYDHGMDRIIVDEGANGPFPGGPFPNGGIPPIGRGVPGQPPFFGMPGVPDAYDPERSGLMGAPDMSAAFGGMMPNPNGPDMMSMMRGGGGGGMRGGRGGRGGRGRGGNHGGYQRHHHQNMSPLNTTLNVEKIPIEVCQISTVNDFFAKFGTITNISVQPQAQKAIIQYSTRAEAEAAYNSPDAIFDNRFVKVYWSKEDPTAPFNAEKTGADATGAGGLQAAGAAKSNEPDPELVAARAAEIAKAREEKQKKHQEHMKHILEIQKKRETQLQQQIDEQKRLLAKLTNSANMTQTEKAELLKALKNIQSDIDTSKHAAANEAAAQAKAATTTTTTATATTSAEEQGAAAADVKQGGETTEDLKKKLARLEAEAANLGIHGSGGFRGGRGGYYGRGRGASSWARGGRGGAMAPRAMTLDNRPTKIAIKNIPETANDVELRQHFQQFGNVTLFEQKDKEALVQYAQRFEAEKAIAAGSHFPKGALQLDWFNQQTTTEG